MQPLPIPIPDGRSRCPPAAFLSIPGPFTNQGWGSTRNQRANPPIFVAASLKHSLAVSDGEIRAHSAGTQSYCTFHLRSVGAARLSPVGFMVIVSRSKLREGVGGEVLLNGPLGSEPLPASISA
jgi:hypothetical protein